jgi:spore maturation protein CgeB
MKALAVLPPDRWMEVNLLETLRAHYCEDLQVFHYPGGMGQLGSSAWRAKRDELNEELVRLARSLKSAGRLHFLFFIVYDDFLLTDTAAQLRALGVPMVNYHIDMAFQWYRVVRTAPYFDVLAVAQMTNVKHLKGYNPNIEWMPMAANPGFYRSGKNAGPAYEYDVTFVGSFNPYRRALLGECAREGIKPTVFGRGWTEDYPIDYSFEWDWYKVVHDLCFYAAPRWKAEGIESLVGPIKRKWSRRHLFEQIVGADLHPPCEDKTMPVLFKTSRVNLGFSDTGWHSRAGIVRSNQLQCRLRDFEVPMSGGFYLVQEAPGHRDYYKVGQEIETWSEPTELVDKTMFYLRNTRAAERIREAGQRRALESHTWQHRFDRLFQRLRSLGKLR